MTGDTSGGAGAGGGVGGGDSGFHVWLVGCVGLLVLILWIRRESCVWCVCGKTQLLLCECGAGGEFVLFVGSLLLINHRITFFCPLGSVRAFLTIY